MAHIPLFQKNLILRTIGEANPLPDAHLKILRKWQASLQFASIAEGIQALVEKRYELESAIRHRIVSDLGRYP